MASKSSKKSPKRSWAKVPTPREYEEFSKAHQNVLIEHMDKNMRAIVEGHTMLQETMERNHAEVTGRLDKVENRIGRVEARFDQVEDRLERVEEIAVEILERMKALESRVAALEARRDIAPLFESFSQNVEEHFRQLEQRVAILETHTT